VTSSSIFSTHSNKILIKDEPGCRLRYARYIKWRRATYPPILASREGMSLFQPTSLSIRGEEESDTRSTRRQSFRVNSVLHSAKIISLSLFVSAEENDPSWHFIHVFNPLTARINVCPHSYHKATCSNLGTDIYVQ
jgi:hypothetical protein